MHLNRTGVVAGVVYLVLGFLWAVATGVPWWVFAWFVVVAAVGAFIPGEANQVSLARAYLAAPALLYAVRGEFAALAVTVSIASVTDLVDGTIARRFARPSMFGGGLDPVVDGVLTGGLVIGLAIGGTLPVWLALVVIARYLLVLLGGVCLFRALRQDSSGLLGAAEVVIPVTTVATYVHLAFALRRPRAGATGAG